MHSPDAGRHLPQGKIGELLIAEGKITEEQLKEALRLQKTDKRHLGKILVSLEYITPDDLARALGLRLNVEYVNLSEILVDPEVLGIISEDVLLQHKALPLRIENGRLMVAMADPNDIYARSDLTISAGYPVAPVIAAEDAIRGLQRQLFEREIPMQIAGTQRTGEVDTTSGADGEANRRAERRVPGTQSEVDLSGTMTEPAVAVNALSEAAPKDKGGSGGQTSGRGGSATESRQRVGGKGARIGEILVSEGKITEEQLEQVLKLQRKDPRDLGKILISLGYAEPTDLAQALAKRLKLEYVVISSLSEDEVDPDALSLLDEETLRKYMALPLRFEDGRLIVAMSEPNDIFALEDLRIIAKCPVTPVVVTEEDLRGAFVHLFGPDDGLYHEVAEEEPVEAEADPETLPPQGEPEEQESANGAVEGGEAKLRDAVVPADSSVEGVVPGAAKGGSLVHAEEPGAKKAPFGSARIGDILVSKGKITREQLDQALAMQKDDPREVGKVLLSLGYITKADLAQALALRLRLDYVELTERDVNRGVVGLVDQKVLRKHGVLPLRLEHGRLVVAMSDPTNVYALEDLTMISGYPVIPIVALEEEIQRVHNKIFAMSEEVSEFLEEARAETVEEDHGEIDLGVEALPDEAPIVRLVSSVLQQAVGDGASDIHIEPQVKEVTVRMRVDGVLRETMSIPPKLQSGVITRLKILGNLDIAERRVPQDGRFSVRLGGQRIDLRVASLPTVHGEKIVLRLLDTSNAQVELPGLGFSTRIFEEYEEIFRRPYGAILVTGPTGSGKSTTLYATLGELNSPEKNIITVEDPVEYRIRGINQIQVNPKAGLTFASSLRSILRADPDIMMIGEIRDFETAKIAVEAALTGHLVLATLHTNDAPGALSRLTDMGVEPFLTSSAVDCVIAQRLARRLCDRCKEPVELGEEILAGMQFPFEYVDESDGLNFHKAVGCPWCGGSGFKGRIGIFELMVVTERVKEMTLRRATAAEIGRAAEAEGMIRLRDDGLLKVAQGMTTIEEVLRTVV